MPLPHVHRLTRDGAPEPADAAPERVLSGSGISLAWNAFSDPSGRFHTGIWHAEPGVRAVDYAETELCVILEGRVRLASDEGSAEFGPGEAFVIAPGFRGSWECLGSVTKIYAILEPGAAT
ncbi:MAG: cupin domain-containing protein [Amaricoccus sp.]|uniref:cupin domain-containing protein n=1 Tax=Amaricoccus sp. TaxID=1872485 RepID=UPI0039E65A8F